VIRAIREWVWGFILDTIYVWTSLFIFVVIGVTLTFTFMFVGLSETFALTASMFPATVFMMYRMFRGRSKSGIRRKERV